MATTIRDVARLAGVGVATASRVISGKGPFSEDAARRVNTAATQLGFRPSNTARALSLQSTGTIGVYVPSFKGPFYGPMLHAIDNELREHDRHMVAANGAGHGDAREQAVDGVAFLIGRECDGIIVTSNALREADLLELRRRQPRIAVVNRDIKGMKAQCFTVDHRLAGRLAGEALLASGHREFAVISGLSDAADNRQRVQGFFDALAKAGIARDRVPTVEADFTAAGGARATDELLARGTRFTALFCANDLMGIAAMTQLQRAGLAVPSQVSVVGYADEDLSAWVYPRLTTLHIPIGDMGLNACRLLMNQCYGLSLPVSRDFTPTLVMRDSLVAPPPRSASRSRGSR
jgi:LacI family transcriptional regulator